MTTRTRPAALGAEAALRSQSLSRGAIGAALLHIEHAHRGTGTWQTVQAHFAAITRHPLIADDHASLFLGAPAVAFALHTAANGTERYAGALHTLDANITALTMHRLDQAHARIDRGHRPRPAEFDLLYGLTGLGAYLLRRHPRSAVLRDVLSYLVRLTTPLPADGKQLPGWWTHLDPTGGTTFPGGHGNLGMAHGITGPLALLALAMLHGTTVDGHTEAIDRICRWLDAQRQDTLRGAWWPRWITLTEQRTGTVAQTGPGRPSWCYGTPGIARAQQLTGLALRDTARQHLAETALLHCLDDPAQLALITDAGLCHGAAGLLHTVHRAAHDALTSSFRARLPRLCRLLLDQRQPQHQGLLEGSTGPALAHHAAAAGGIPACDWDTCFLLH